MNDDDIKRALELVNYFRDTAQRIVMQGSSPFAMKVADLIDALLGEAEHWKAEAESWEKQASDRVDDALKFAAERDALKAENASIRALMDCYNLGGWTDSLRLMQERNALARDAAYWKEEARRYCANSDFWRERATSFAEKGASDES